MSLDAPRRPLVHFVGLEHVPGRLPEPESPRIGPDLAAQTVLLSAALGPEPAARPRLLRLTQARIGDTLHDGNGTRVAVVNAFTTVNPDYRGDRTRGRLPSRWHSRAVQGVFGRRRRCRPLDASRCVGRGRRVSPHDERDAGGICGRRDPGDYRGARGHRAGSGGRPGGSADLVHAVLVHAVGAHLVGSVVPQDGGQQLGARDRPVSVEVGELPGAAQDLGNVVGITGDVGQRPRRRLASNDDLVAAPLDDDAPVAVVDRRLGGLAPDPRRVDARLVLEQRLDVHRDRTRPDAAPAAARGLLEVGEGERAGGLGQGRAVPGDCGGCVERVARPQVLALVQDLGPASGPGGLSLYDDRLGGAKRVRPADRDGERAAAEGDPRLVSLGARQAAAERGGQASLVVALEVE